MEPKTPKELYWAKMAGEDVILPEPKTPEEAYLAKMAGDDVTLPDPKTPKEYYMKSVAENGGGGGGTSDMPPLVSALVTATYVFDNPSFVDAEFFGLPMELYMPPYAAYKDGDDWNVGMDYNSETYVAEYNAVGYFNTANGCAPTWEVKHGVAPLEGYQVISAEPSNMVNITAMGKAGYKIVDPTQPASITWTIEIGTVK